MENITQQFEIFRLPLLAEVANANQFGVNWTGLITQVALFFIVLFVLSKYAFKPVVSMLAERQKRIEESQLNAEKIQSQLDEAQIKIESIMAKAHADAQHLMEEAKSSAGRLQEQKHAQAIQEAERIVNKAKESIEIERSRIMDEMKKEVGRLVVEATTRVTGKILTSEDQQRINADAIHEFVS